MRFVDKEVNPQQLSPLNLAFIGDCIYEILTEEETTVFKRGRNAKVGHNPKSASQSEYHTATGMEALFGWLYLTEQMPRMKELFKIISE